MAENRKPHGGGHGPHGGPRGGFGKPKDLRRTALRTMGYILNRPALLVAALVCVAVSALLGVAATYLQKPIIDNITLAFKAGQAQLPGLLAACLHNKGIIIAIHLIVRLHHQNLKAAIQRVFFQVLHTDIQRHVPSALGRPLISVLRLQDHTRSLLVCCLAVAVFRPRRHNGQKGQQNYQRPNKQSLFTIHVCPPGFRNFLC